MVRDWAGHRRTTAADHQYHPESGAGWRQPGLAGAQGRIVLDDAFLLRELARGLPTLEGLRRLRRNLRGYRRCDFGRSGESKHGFQLIAGARISDGNVQCAFGGVARKYEQQWTAHVPLFRTTPGDRADVRRNVRTEQFASTVRQSLGRRPF